MKITEKLLKNISKIMKVTGFYIIATGDPSVGINPSSWELKEDFYFDDEEELQIFKEELRKVFEWYCGEIAHIQTFEEYQKQLDAEDLEYFAQFPVRYLVRDRDYGANTFKQTGCCASYASAVGTAIHAELPKWIPEEGDTEYEVIKSTDSIYKQILLKEAQRLENEIRDEEYRLNNAKMNLRIIAKELNIGLKIKK